MTRSAYPRLIIILLLSATLGSGCFLFRKKNRCGDCPTWSKEKTEQKAPAKQS